MFESKEMIETVCGNDIELRKARFDILDLQEKVSVLEDTLIALFNYLDIFLVYDNDIKRISKRGIPRIYKKTK